MANSDLILSLDVGTTNVKAAVVDSSGQLLTTSHRAMTVEQDVDGRAEHNPNQLFQAVVDCLAEASDGYSNRVAIIVPATYQMGLIALDCQNQPVTGMMTLLDTRARETYAALLDILPGKTLYDLTGCPPVFHFPLAKLFWLKTKRPGTFSNARMFLSAKDYLLFRLAGLRMTDTSVSSTTQYMNIRSLAWEEKILSAVGVTPDCLPEVKPPETLVTGSLDSIKKTLNLPNLQGLLLGTYDGGAVGIGLGAKTADTAVMNFGTTAMLRYCSDNPALSTDGTMRVQSSYLAADRWIPGGAINNAGSVLNWLTEVFKEKYPNLLTEAKAASDSSGLLFLPYLTGERSLDVGTSASGSYFGLRSHHSRGQMVRAALEGVAYSLRRVQESVVSSGFTPKIIRVGSGASHSALWMEIVASVLNTPLQTTHASEPGLLGSAMLGFVALGRFPDLETATREMVRPDRSYRPEPTDVKIYAAGYEMFGFLTSKMKEADEKFAR